MKRKRVQALALALAAVLLLSSCAIGGYRDPRQDMVWWETAGSRELETFFIFGTERGEDHNVLANAYTPLLEINNKGQLCPAAASEWNTPDGGLTWYFTLRDDVKWVDVNGNKRPCVPPRTG